jgi:hypothetical protein
MSHDLTHLEQWLGTYAGGAWLQLPAGSFAGWAAQAGRFSFQPEEL